MASPRKTPSLVSADRAWSAVWKPQMPALKLVFHSSSRNSDFATGPTSSLGLVCHRCEASAVNCLHGPSEAEFGISSILEARV